MNLQIGVYLDQPMFRQEDREMILSPRRPHIVDCFSIDQYIYDGGGGSIGLQNDDGTTLHKSRDASRAFYSYKQWKVLKIQQGHDSVKRAYLVMHLDWD